jgi:hypothetical protein
MGLDIVEFALAVEEAFDVDLDRATWSRISSPRDLIAHLNAVLSLSAASCTTQQAFYSVRRGIVRTWNLPRTAVGPSTPWTALIPPDGARPQWRALGENVTTGYWPQRWILGGPRADHATVGALATFLATTQPARIKRRPATWTASEIESIVRRVMLELLGLEHVSLDASFSRDLGIC